MAKVVDITEKLSFDENPVLKIKEESIEVRADAETILKIMGYFNGDFNEIEASRKAAELLFNDTDAEKIAKLKLSFKDYLILIEEAINLATGKEEAEGEQ